MWKSEPAKSVAGIEKPPTYRVILVQCLSVILIALAVYLLKGQEFAVSAILGGLLVILPNAYFAWRAFRYNQTRSAAHLVGGFVQAELGKFLITALLFALVFKLVKPLVTGALFASFVVVLLVGLIASAFLLQARPNR